MKKQPILTMDAKADTFSYFTYEIGNNNIVLIDYDLAVWEKYEP